MATTTEVSGTYAQNVMSAVAGTTFTMDGRTYTVEPACKADRGQWCCTTCGEVFRHQLEKDAHISNPRQQHVLAWVCFEHGPEAP